MSSTGRFVLIEKNNGFDIETFDTLEGIIRASAYRFCATNQGDTEKLQKIIDKVIVEVLRDWATEEDIAP